LDPSSLLTTMCCLATLVSFFVLTDGGMSVLHCGVKSKLFMMC
jgi:hypothetical protein